MATVCITRRADCLLRLGRLDEAAATYEEGIRRDERRRSERDVAVGKFQLGTVRLYQRRYQDALTSFEEAREAFTRMGEPVSVARAWHQIGMAYQSAGQAEAAEDAYQESLMIKVRLGDVAGQSSTLIQLGTLYGDMPSRIEEAAVLLRQAAEKRAEIGDVAGEGRARNNLANTLQRLRRHDEARREIRQAIACLEQFGYASEPWKAWAILAEIEADSGEPAAARDATRMALASYLAYRREGGENHGPEGQLCLSVTQALLRGDSARAASILQPLAARPNLTAGWLAFLQALAAIIAGSRDRALADSEDLDYDQAAEILFLIETLEQRRAPLHSPENGRRLLPVAPWRCRGGFPIHDSCTPRL